MAEPARSVMRTHLVKHNATKEREKKIKARRDGRWDQLPNKPVDSPVTHSVGNWEPLGTTSNQTAECVGGWWFVCERA